MTVISRSRGTVAPGPGGSPAVTGSALSVTPAGLWLAGETVLTTITRSVMSSSGQTLSLPKVFQFTTAVGGTGRGNFLGGTSGGGGVLATQLNVADLDGDRDLDYVLSDAYGEVVHIYLNGGSNTGVFSWLYDQRATNPSYLTTGDVDGDGDVDLVVARSSSSSVTVLYNNGAARFSNTAVVPIPGNSTAQTLQLADVDGDGDLDMLAASDFGVVICLNQGYNTGQFVYTRSVAGGVTRQLATGDVDGDGDLDLVTSAPALTNGTPGNLTMYLNGGDASGSNTGVFGGARTIVTMPGNYAQTLRLADVDNDQDLDVVVTENRTLTICLNGGDNTGSNTGVFTVTAYPNQPWSGSSMDMGDVDADGDVDIVVTDATNAPYAQNYATVMLNGGNASGSGTGQFVNAGTFATGSAPNSMALADIDGDADLDALVNASNQGVAIRLNQPPPPSIISFNPAVARAGQTVTLTGTDLAGATALRINGVTASILSNTGTSLTFAVPSGAPATGTSTLTTVGGSGTNTAFTVKLEALGTSPQANARTAGRTNSLVSVVYSEPVTGVSAAQTRVFSSQLGGRKQGAVTILGNTARFSATAGTARTHFAPGELVHVTLPATVRTAAGVPLVKRVLQFTTSVGGAGRGMFQPGLDLALTDGPWGVRAADVDGDGDLDLLTANYHVDGSANTVSVRLNNGSGVFSAGSEVPVGGGPRSVTAADVDGDGDLDLLAANYGTTLAGGNTVSIRLNSGNGTFSSGSEVLVGANPVEVVAADVDADGDLDLLAANADRTGATHTVSVRLNNGSGGFGGGTEVLVGGTPLSLTAADVDGDGDLDLLTANDSNTASVRFNDGNGVFAGGSDLAVDPTPMGITAADVDADGDADILTANLAGTVSVCLNDGRGNLAAGPAVAVGAGARSVVAADVDADGDMDLLTANNSSATSGSVSVRLNNGAGQFAGSTEVATSGTACHLVAADLDGDSDLDLLVANPYGGVGVRLNQAAPPTITTIAPAAGPAGTVVTVTGTGFVGTTRVAINGTPATFSVASVTSLTVTVPATATSGPLTVTTAAGTGTSSASFVVTGADLVVASAMTISGGTYHNVTVTGTGTGVLAGDLVVTGTVDVQPGGVLQDGGHTISGSGGFVLQAGATLVICSPDGISQGGATGSVQVTGARSFQSGASYRYNGALSAQVTGTGLPAQVRNLVVSNPAGVTLSQGVAVEQALALRAGDLNTNGQVLTLLSSAAGTALVVNRGSGVVSGPATVQRYIDGSQNAGLGYRHYSAPVAGSTVADLATGGFSPVVNPTYNSSVTPNLMTPFPTVFGYDEARVLSSPATTYSAFDKGWASPAALSDPLTVGRGYTVNIAASQLVDFVGTLGNGLVARGLTRAGGTNGGLHLVGNPYPAPIDWSAVSVPTGLDNAVYVYQSTGQYTGGYRSYVNGVGNPRIASSQGFFVRLSPGASSAQLAFTNAVRDTSYVAGSSFNRGVETRPLVQLLLRGAGSPLVDEAYVYFENGATAGVDARYDALKLQRNSGGMPSVYALAAGTELSINGLPQLLSSTVVPLGVNVPAAGRYAFEAAQLLNLTTAQVYLHDAVTGQDIDLRRQPTYSFTAGSTALPGRFELRFEPQRPTASTAGLTAASVTLFPNPAHQRVTLLVPAVASAKQVTATLLNSLGQVVATQTVFLPAAGTQLTFDVTPLATGVYTVRLQAGDATVAKRLVMEQH